MKLRDFAQKTIYKALDPVVRGMIRIGITPNLITATGLLLNIVACIFFIHAAIHNRRGDFSWIGWAGAIILFSGLFDMMDGQVARIGNMNSKYGALFDSVLDRYSELVVYFGICYYLIMQEYFFSSIFAFLALIGSMMVSYVRARAEGLGVECKTGFMQRPERVVITAAGAILCGIFYYFMGDYKMYVPAFSFPVFEPVSILVIPIVFVAVFSNITAIGRLNHCRKAIREQETNDR